MTYKALDGFDAAQIPLIVDMIPVAITIIDLEGHILFYNDYSRQVLNRKPEYLGSDIRDCHQKPVIMGTVAVPDFVAGQFR